MELETEAGQQEKQHRHANFACARAVFCSCQLQASYLLFALTSWKEINKPQAALLLIGEGNRGGPGVKSAHM